MWTRKTIGVVAALVLTGVVLAAQGAVLKTDMVRPADLKFVTMPNGTFQADVIGAAAQPGTYAVRTKLPAGLRLPPHFHPDSRIVVVLSGTFYFGYGERFDQATMTAMTPGSVFTEPAGQPHFGWAKDAEVVLHVTGVGPTATTWVEQKQ
ncbi:MAG: cupin domain-containing protein [Acidobacteriota bacterium]